MKTRILTIALSGIFLFSAARADVAAQTLPGNVHETSETYYPPQDSAVREKLCQWRDLKFGVLFHWGLYSIPGIVESWAVPVQGISGHHTLRPVLLWPLCR